mgnify:CR=1 FL=1
MLNLNWQIIWTFVNIIVLFLLLKKFLFSRVTRIMDEREALINGNIEQAEQQSREAEELKTRYTFTADNVEGILQDEVGKVFARVLQDAGVYKCTPEGRAAFQKFIASVQ